MSVNSPRPVEVASRSVAATPSRPHSRQKSGALIPVSWTPVLIVGLVLALVVSVVLAVAVGSVAVAPDRAAGILWRHLVFWQDTPVPDRLEDAIIWKFRAPRALLAVVVGAGLAVGGAVLQALVRNALADPYVLGVEQGASFGAVLMISAGTAAVGKAAVSVAAFAGAVVCLLLVLLLGRRRGQLVPSRLVLVGVAIGYLFQAGTSFIQLSMSQGESLAGVLFWLLGTVAAASWSDLGVPAAVVALATSWLMLQARPLNALLAGEETAITLGVDVRRFRIWLLVVASLLAGTTVAVAGGIGFVGLMIPHIARLLVGVDHRRMLPVCLLLGALFLELVDVIARTAAAPLELPLTVVTAVAGAPFFLWLMRRADRGEAVR